jgi:hypothetical protein
MISGIPENSNFSFPNPEDTTRFSYSSILKIETTFLRNVGLSKNYTVKTVGFMKIMFAWTVAA